MTPPQQPFTAKAVLADLQTAMRECISLQQQSWLIRDVFPTAGHLLGEIRIRVRAAVTNLLTTDLRKADLVRELGIPRITIDTWTMSSAKSPSTNPVGIAAATSENLAGARAILDVEKIVTDIEEQSTSLEGLDKARYLIAAQHEADELVAELREVRKLNGVARLSEGVRRQALVNDLGITGVTVHQWAKLAVGPD